MGEKSDYSEENYKTHLEIWMENSNLQFERENIETIRPPLDLTDVGAKMSDGKKHQQRKSQHVNKPWKDYVAEDPDP